MPKPNLVPTPHATGIPEGGPKKAAWQKGTMIAARRIDLVMFSAIKVRGKQSDDVYVNWDRRWRANNLLTLTRQNKKYHM
mmetsp:Transcript_10028/g.19694  ORF Transcript_10028/g.19694 Transcript_10028/m.19694 type:complete len:80 (-) Transcript_10028:19-258(-)